MTRYVRLRRRATWHEETGVVFGPAEKARCFRFAASACLAILTLAATCCGQSLTRLDFVMFTDPRLDLPSAEWRFKPELLPLWLAALEAPQEADLRQQAARTLAWAHSQGMPGLEAAIGPLTKRLTQDDRRLVRLTAAQTLVALDARQSAQALFDRAQTDGLDMAQLVEPALARWRFQRAIDVWRRRLQDDGTDRQRLLLAIRGLGEVREAPAADRLLGIAVSTSQPPDLRLAAATAAGHIRRSGLEATARQLRSGPPAPDLVARLVAVRLLREHDSAEARTLLVALVQDEDSAVMAGALEPLLALEPARIVPLAKPTLARGDANVRRLVAQALTACPSADNLALLAELFNDSDPSLREDARRFLEKLAQSSDWRPEVLRQGERLLQNERWTALEQSAVLLGTLGHLPAADRLVELLAHARPEVYVAAAWGLRRLGVDRTLAPALEAARLRNGKRPELLTKEVGQPGLDHQLAHLFEFFGQKKFAPAEPFLRSFVPKDLTVTRARSAAIWALGHFHENHPDAELVAALQERINDTGMPAPEHEHVRLFSAITLGRMKASDALPMLETFNNPKEVTNPIGYACAWSIERLTGRPIPPLVTPIKYHSRFFLEPRAAKAP